MTQCKGMNCGTTTGNHSPECRAEYAAAVAGGRFVKSGAMQQKAIDYGFKYWRAPDAHGVTATNAQAVELLQHLLGVEVEIKDKKVEQQAVWTNRAELDRANQIGRSGAFWCTRSSGDDVPLYKGPLTNITKEQFESIKWAATLASVRGLGKTAKALHDLLELEYDYHKSLVGIMRRENNKAAADEWSDQ